MARKITIQLDKDTAFTVFAFLSRFAYRGSLEVRDEKEKAALVDLCQTIDNELVEMFRDGYERFLERTKGD